MVDFARSLVGADDGSNPPSPPAQLRTYNIHTASGSTITPDTTPDSGNAIVVPDGYNGIAVYVGERPATEALLRVWVKVGSASAYKLDMFTYRKVTINATAGTTIAFGTSSSTKATPDTFADGATDITVTPTKVSAAHNEPVATPLTIIPDQASPNRWAPSITHLRLPDQYQTIKIQSKPYQRNIFTVEYNPATQSIAPTRHIVIKANESPKIDMRYQCIAFANLTGEAIDIVAPPGSEIKAIGTRDDIAYTPAKSVTVGSVDGFWVAMGDLTVDEIVLQAGNYDLSAPGRRMNRTNYANAMKRDLRIRGATGVAGDVTFIPSDKAYGGKWDIDLSASTNGAFHTWIMHSVSWNNEGCANPTASSAMINIVGGAFHMVNCTYYGASAAVSPNPAGDTSIKWLSGGDTTTSYVMWCNIQRSNDDLLSSFVQSGGLVTTHLIGCYLDGNGPNNNSQVITNHGGCVMYAWGCSFGNLSTGNVCTIAADNPPSWVYLNYCYSRSSNFIGSSKGIRLNSVDGYANGNASFMHFCDFEGFYSAGYLTWAICSIIKGLGSGTNVLNLPMLTKAVYIGLDVYMNPNGSQFETAIDVLDDSHSPYAAKGKAIGLRVTGYSANLNTRLIRLLHVTAGTSAAQSLEITQFLLRSKAGPVNMPLLEINSGSAYAQTVALKNGIFVSENAAGSNITISGSANNGSTIANTQIQGSTPSNYNTAFPSPVSTTISATSPTLSSGDLPLASGARNIVGTGGDIGLVGASDINGRPWLGGVWTPGAVETTDIKPGQVLYPDVWI